MKNILFIQCDQLRYDCIGYANQYPVQTPHLDRLAKEGMVFYHAYTPLPSCCPARQSLLNGKRPEAIGALWNYDITLKIPALEPTEYAWPRDLKSQGYNTAYVGKWHVNPDHDPTDYGYDEYIPMQAYRDYSELKHGTIELQNGYFGEPNPRPLEESQTHWLAEQAISFIEKYNAQDQPWHVRLDFPEPHLPCCPAEPFSSMYAPEDIPKWGGFDDDFENKPYIQKQQVYTWELEDMTWEDWSHTVAMYYGIISQMDDAIGRVLECIASLGLNDDIIVVFTSDHGDNCGDHRMIDKHYTLYDNLTRVPLIIKYPGVTEPASECDEFVSNSLDLGPTVLDMMHIAPPENHFHGSSLVPLLQGKSPNDWRQEIVCTYNGQQFGLYTQRAIRNKTYKYVWNTTDVDELYYLPDDPYELKNVVYQPDHQKALKELRVKLYDELIRCEDGLVAKSQWMQAELLHNRKL